MISHKRSLLLFASLPLVLATGCGIQPDSDSGSADRPPTADASVDGPVVTLTKNEFTPASMEVAAGDAVAWVWEDGSHDVVFDDGEGSEIQREGTWSRTFDEPGTYDYRCTVHSGMTGTVVVG